MTDDSRTKLDADGRHWMVMYRGRWCSGFKTEQDALRFLDSAAPTIFIGPADEDEDAHAPADRRQHGKKQP